MRLQDFSGRGAAVRSLCEAFLVGAPPHAVLMFGQPGIGKRTLANLLAQSLFCVGQSKPCGVCAACARYAAGSHPDAHRVIAKKSIGVDEIRQLTVSLHAAAYEGGWKTAIIEDAGAMTVQAQNSLLKTIEEPPAKTVFLLTAVSAGQMLPTVRSRCRPVRMLPMAVSDVASVLHARGVGSDRAGALAELSAGSVGDALALECDEAFWALRTRLFSAMYGIRGPADVLGVVNELKDQKEDASRICDMLEKALADALKCALTGTESRADDTWQTILRRADVKSLVRLVSWVPEMRRMLKSNVPWHAVYERFLLEYAEEVKKWQL